jgi:short-subunit dehydrogenase
MVGGIERIIAEQGRIDVLVNNAGYGSYGAVEDVPLEEARRQFEVNLFGLARLVQLVTPHMREQKSGRIINISSIGAVIYEPFGAWYHATKFAVDGFSDSLRVELRPFGIDVVLIHPAGIITEWNEIPGTRSSTQQGRRVRRQSVKAAKAIKRRQPAVPRWSQGDRQGGPGGRSATRPAGCLDGDDDAPLPDRAFDAILTRTRYYSVSPPGSA